MVQNRLGIIYFALKRVISTRLRRMRSVAMKASIWSPAQTQSQIAAVAHIFAAVVSPLVLSPVFIIAQAHRKPTPETT
jgi:hypothetical protein